MNEELLITFLEAFAKLTDEERHDVIDKIGENYCTHCWCTDPSCPCWNDE